MVIYVKELVEVLDRYASDQTGMEEELLDFVSYEDLMRTELPGKCDLNDSELEKSLVDL